ncbi:MAG: L-2-amino-thiazoline-4-carboxylic acid hydrolase, partial [Desulfobacterales bacterium]|nr:L-2-amino-thiazoline-4-carboxylic acid hydrolase [Desulfobacterales bacterium]
RYSKGEKYLRMSLNIRFNGVVLDSVLDEIRLEYLDLIPHVPYIGGNENPIFSNMLLESVIDLAIYKVLKKRNVSVNDIGTIILETFNSRINTSPKILTKIVNMLLFSSLVKLLLKKRAQKSQARIYEMDWVFNYVDGNGEGFDYGVDYLECAICKYYHLHNADEIIKFKCQCDFPLSELFGWGLKRTTTIAEGKQKCDFRFKKEKIK